MDCGDALYWSILFDLLLYYSRNKIKGAISSYNQPTKADGFEGNIGFILVGSNNVPKQSEYNLLNR